MAQEEDTDAEGDEWVIGTWHVYYGVELHAVCQRDGKPLPHFWPSGSMHEWFRWRSYHAARKYQRSHAELEGYEIVNLSRLRRQCWEERRRREERKKHEG